MLFKLYMKLKGFTILKTEKKLMRDGKKVDITFYSGEGFLVAQMIPFFHRIIVNEHLANEPGFTYVLEHEYAHYRQYWFMLPLVVLALLSGVIAFMFFWVFIGHLLAFFFGRTTIKLLVGDFIIVTIALSVFMSLIWISEFFADFRAIRYVGLQEYKRFLDAPRDWQQKTLLHRVLGFLTHPPPKAALFFFRLFQ